MNGAERGSSPGFDGVKNKVFLNVLFFQAVSSRLTVDITNQSNVGIGITEPLIHEITIHNHLSAQIADFIMSVLSQKLALDSGRPKYTSIVYVSHYAQCAITHQCLLILSASCPLVLLSFKKDSRTRGHEVKLVKDQCRLDIRKHSFSQRTINVWNKLSTDCVTASSVNMFKNKVDTYLRRAGYK